MFKRQALKSCESRGWFRVHWFRLPRIQPRPVPDNFSCINPRRDRYLILKETSDNRVGRIHSILKESSETWSILIKRRRDWYSTTVLRAEGLVGSTWYSRSWSLDRYLILNCVQSETCKQKHWTIGDAIIIPYSTNPRRKGWDRFGTLNKFKTQSMGSLRHTQRKST